MRRNNGSPVGVAVLALAAVLIGLLLWLVIYPFSGTVGCVITVASVLVGVYLLVRRVKSHM